MKKSRWQIPMTRWNGWAQVDDGGKVITICGGPMIYRTKKDALQDLDDPMSTVRRIVVVEVADER